MLKIVKFMQIVYNNIVSILKSKGLTKRALAEYLGFNETAVNRIIRNDRITLDTLLKISKFLTCSVFDLISGIDEKPRKPDAGLSSTLDSPTAESLLRIIAEKDAQIKRLFDLLERK